MSSAPTTRGHRRGQTRLAWIAIAAVATILVAAIAAPSVRQAMTDEMHGWSIQQAKVHAATARTP